MQNLHINRLSHSCDVLGPVAEGIRRLSIDSMDPNLDDHEWAAEMVLKNGKTLDHLNLGFNTHVAHHYALERAPRHDRMTPSLATALKEALRKSDQQLITLSLSSLYLCGLDFGSLIRGELALDIHFNHITELRLESCSGLTQAFALLMGQEHSSNLALGALKDLYVRLEGPDPNTSDNLTSFLTSIGGLDHLQVLVDNSQTIHHLESILKVHGETLNTLIWDERSGPRRSLRVSTSMLPTKLGNLRVVSKYCPNLIVLGLPLDWEAISSSDTYHEAVIPPPALFLALCEC